VGNQTRRIRRDGTESLSQAARPTVNRARFKLGVSCDEADYLVLFGPILPTKCMSFSSILHTEKKRGSDPE
jgi:hypothetical protein